MAIETLKLNVNGNEEVFRLNECEQAALAQMKSKVNSEWGEKPLDARFNDDLGYDQIITTLTAVETRIARQKNIEYDVSDAIDVVAGAGAWREQGIYFRSFPNGGDTLDSWRLDQAQQGATKSQSTASVDSVTYPYTFLGKMISYTKVELEQAAASGIWNAIEEKSYARKHEFDLRFAEFAFKGTADGAFKGLLTLSDIETDSDTIITKKLYKMSDSDFQTALGNLFQKSYSTANMTARPNRFLIPMLDYIGLGSTWSSVGSGFVNGRNRLALLEEAFRNYTGDASAKVIGSNFANAALNGGIDQYVMYRKDPFELKIENPVPFGVYPGASVDGFNFQNTALAQVSGVICKYPRQMLYIKNSTPNA